MAQNIIYNPCVYACMLSQSCLTICDSMDSSPPGSSIHEIFQAKVLEWGAIAFSKKWQPTPVFLPGESHRQRRLEGYERANSQVG